MGEPKMTYQGWRLFLYYFYVVDGLRQDDRTSEEQYIKWFNQEVDMMLELFTPYELSELDKVCDSHPEFYGDPICLPFPTENEDYDKLLATNQYARDFQEKYLKYQ